MKRIGLLIPLLLWLTACGTLPRGGGYYQDDGPDARVPADVMNTPDAVPKFEPKATAGNNPYSVFGTTYQPLSDARGYRERGVASWYGKKFNGQRTSSGEPYDMYSMTAAHKTLPLPSYVRVRNLDNGRSIVVRVNDRGPFLHDRLIDLSYAGAAKLGILGTGTGHVEVEAITAEDSKPSGVQIFPVAAAAEVKAEEIPPAAVATPKLFLQIGAFSQKENADSLRQRLEHESIQEISIQPTSGAPGAAPLYRVRIGPLTNVEEADRLTQRLTEYGVSGAKIVVE